MRIRRIFCYVYDYVFYDDYGGGDDENVNEHDRDDGEQRVLFHVDDHENGGGPSDCAPHDSIFHSGDHETADDPCH